MHVVYEQPLNERTRTLLRLETLLAQAEHHAGGRSAWDSRAAVAAINEMLQICTRTDLKSELIKELERQCAVLERMRGNPDVDSERLGETLDELRTAVRTLHGTPGKIAEGLRQNEFLLAVRQRSAIPGGTCAFDLPGFHCWLSQPPEGRHADLEDWLAAFAPLGRAIALTLRLTRESALPTREQAREGFYQEYLDSATPCRLLRVILPADLALYPEISAGRHRFTIRFMEPASEGRPQQTEREVAFRLARCML
ncbi:cell division protein ZapD [Inmirania thermothiophila]|uniref:Cell division protein ZapD n=1 Tax=Inmirania thermothiophila TaxID=1750597 RepID=A0A3N1XXP8_9GAMM|nr:cell division protein ZapD [Inmirania thermothiophila]ROR29697.1 cell division protein ZapD [Inmirania thermothiophila]